MELTYFGHSCFLANVAGYKLLFDPFITYNTLAKDVDITAIKADYILISHGHQDHIADVEVLAKQTGAILISNWEVIQWFGKKGIDKNHPMNVGGKKKFPFGTVTVTPALHSSSMPDGAYGGNPVGFVVETPEKSFYYAGDTDVFLDMQLIGNKHVLDFALMPIGDNFTMGIEGAVESAGFVRTDHIIGMHYDTFPYIVIDHEEAAHCATKKAKKLTLIEIGKSITL